MKAEFISNMGSDGTVCDAARVSFDKAASNYTADQNARLIKYLASHGRRSRCATPCLSSSLGRSSSTSWGSPGMK